MNARSKLRRRDSWDGNLLAVNRENAKNVREPWKREKTAVKPWNREKTAVKTWKREKMAVKPWSRTPPGGASYTIIVKYFSKKGNCLAHLGN